MAVQKSSVPGPKYPPDFLRNGLQFENDRRHKNKFALLVISSMTVLIVVATSAFVAWSKLKSFQGVDVIEETRVTLIISKVPINYDTDTVQTPSERSVLPDVRTEFIPTFRSRDTTNIRTTRDTKSQIDASSTSDGLLSSGNYDGRNETSSLGDDQESSEEIVWVKVKDKSKRNAVHPDEKRNTESKTPLLVRTGSAHKEVFWTTKGDSESIRKSQAERMTSYMDFKADPCQDFYQYACGRWGDHNQIPEDRTQFDTFEMLRESLDSVLRDLLFEESKSTEDPDAVRKAKHLFKSCMNEDTLKEKGNTPLLQLLDSLGGWPMIDPNWNDTAFDWLELSAKLRLYNNEILIMQWVSPDFKSSSNYIIQFDQASLGLPTREYFLQEHNSRYLEAYRAFMIRVALLLGASPENANKDVDELMAFETELANISTPADQRNNVSAMYEKLPLYQLERQLPQIAWRRYLSIVLQREPEDDESVVMFARKYYGNLINLLQTTNNRTLANYLLWRFVKNRVNNLDTRFENAKQEFFHSLFGREKVPPRWSTCVMHVNANMGMAVGSIFVHRYFDENSKNDTLTMTHAIMDAFTGILEVIDWIDAETRQLAREKVAAMVLRIGYPDFILDPAELNLLYENLSISENDYFGNTLNLLQHTSRTAQNRLGTPVDRTQWGAAPAIVNAYYSRNKNQIMFPAGILQPPFYHRHFPRSLNYGGIGVVIGHEIIHGFDDKGGLFDLYGNLHRWWKDEALEGFRQRAQCLIDQYNTYIVKEVEMRIDGISTQGENIADNGGMKQAYKAYQKWVETHGDQNETLPGVNATNWQLFFINFAQVWCGSMRPEASRNKLQTGVHSPGRFRVIGTLSNSNEFTKAFNCASATSMNPSAKCSVW